MADAAKIFDFREQSVRDITDTLRMVTGLRVISFETLGEMGQYCTGCNNASELYNAHSLGNSMPARCSPSYCIEGSRYQKFTTHSPSDPASLEMGWGGA